MLKTVVLTLLTTASFAHASEYDDTIDPTPAQCLASFAENYVPEYNMPNDYILSTDPKAVSGALDVIKSNGFASWVNGFADANLNKYTQAVGVVFNYMDEIHMIVTSINIEAGKCQVKEIIDINTVDIEKNSDPSLLNKYFLGLPTNKIKALGLDEIQEDVKNSLLGLD
jgi:hypothetical protein